MTAAAATTKETERAEAAARNKQQKEPPEPLVIGNFAKIVLVPERGWLRERIDRRFEPAPDGGCSMD